MRIKVTLRYMDCIKETFICDMLFVNTDKRILSWEYSKGYHVDTGWTLDGNTAIEAEEIP